MTALTTFLRHLFCRHIWRTDREDDLNRHYIEPADLNFTAFEHYRIYAVHQTCVKCGKGRVYESHHLQS